MPTVKGDLTVGAVRWHLANFHDSQRVGVVDPTTGEVSTAVCHEMKMLDGQWVVVLRPGEPIGNVHVGGGDTTDVDHG